jgi:DNA-binding NarL/FixJ family response regulator
MSEAGVRAVASSASRRVVIADEEPLFLDGLRLLCQQGGLTVAGIAHCRGDVVPLVLRVRPDVIVLGCFMSPLHGLEAARQITRALPGANVLLLAGVVDEGRLAEAWQAGARGVALRWLPVGELLLGIQEVAAGRTCVRGLQESRVNQHHGAAGTRPHTALTSRECEVLSLIAEGKSIKQIAASLSIAPKTAEHHRARICGKLAVRTTAHLVRCAVRFGLVAS